MVQIINHAISNVGMQEEKLQNSLYLFFVYIFSCTTVLFITAVPVLFIHFQMYSLLLLYLYFLFIFRCTLYFCCTCSFDKLSAVPLYSLLLLYLYFLFISRCTLYYWCTCTFYSFPDVLFITAVPVLRVNFQLYSLFLLYLYSDISSSCTPCTTKWAISELVWKKLLYILLNQ